ncbi:protein kinase [Ruminococcus sp. 5_1_39BFAA]|uniref:protein kinase domain-containing protein n=1 Tax=Ruminococcus sp. 5_1_39BFAA TaxID=457412 RepID=UPI003565F1B8
MPEGIKGAKRIRLTGQTMEIKFVDAKGCGYTYKITVDNELGEGSSSICYEATVFKSRNSIGQKRILKQFYPDPKAYGIDAKIDGINLDIRGFYQNEAVRKLADLFEAAYDNQVDLSNREELTGVIVRPDLNHFDGPTKYILYEPDHGTYLQRDQIGSLEEMIRIFYQFAAALEKLHSQRIIHMDLKPENVLVTGDQGIKFFDFDASINMDHVSEIHLEDIRGDERQDLLAPELRLQNQREFEQNKRDFLNERVDIYSFGAILFSFLLDRYPGMEDCRTRDYEKQLRRLYNERYRGALTEKEADMLNHVIWKCIQADLSAKGRYKTTHDLVNDLRELWNSVNTPITNRRKEFQVVNGRLQAAYVMDKYPLSRFRRKGENRTWRMDVLIAGDDPVGDDFFENIYACAQMLDTRIVIRLASKDAQDRLYRLFRKWPLMKKTTEVYLNEMPVAEDPNSRKVELDLSITKTPFAEVWFYEWDSKKREILDLYQSMKEHCEISWMILADDRIEENIEHARKLERAAGSSGKQVFVGYLDERGDGFDLRKLEPEHKNVIACPFSCNDKYSLEENEFSEGIRKQALLLHKHYMREWNECADTLEIWKDFSSSSYNVNSSLCSVLSIPYKLESIGIKTTGTEAAAEFYYDVLSGTEKAKKTMNKLIYLEHRRWMCFMVTEGYDKPSWEQISRYAFKGKNDQRNREGGEKLHAMLCDSDPESGARLHELSRGEWEKPDFQDTARREGRPFDELDCMSVWLHQLCSQRVEKMNLEEGGLRDIFSALERNMRDEKFGDEEFEILKSLKIVCRRMLDNESNINHLWDRMCKKFALMIRDHDKKAKLHVNGVTDTFKALKNAMRVVVERNKYHDYKSSDQTILEAIPLLLLSEDPIRRIHKPAGSQSWHNIVSSLIMEPDELILYTDQPEELERDLIENFLQEERGLKTAVKVCTMDELYNLKITKRSLKSVLDITGLSAMETFEITNKQNLVSIPAIIFKDGRIRSMRGRSETDYYSVLKRHLTVKETFRLFHSNIHSDDGENLMLGLSSNYEDLWKAYVSMKPFRWRQIVDTLYELEEGTYWKIDTENILEKPVTKIFRQIPRALILDTKIDKVLEDLRSRNFIESGYCIPDTGQMGTVTIRTKYGDVSQYIDGMFYLARKHYYMHRFCFVESQREAMTGKPSNQILYYIHDDTLVVDRDMVDEIRDGERKSDIVQQALFCLYDQKSKKEEYTILEPLDEKPMIEKKTVKGKNGFHIQFVYKNHSTKECLMKEENILEAYTYHSIWNRVFVDDIKLNVAFTWDAGHSDDPLARGAVTSGIDLVCTKNMQTYFISCKQTRPQKEYLQEIRFLADYFGIDGKAIIITSDWEDGGKTLENSDKDVLKSKSKRMEVYYITGGMLGDSPEKMSGGNLAGYIQNIIDGKRDWMVLD